jgi:hypothetical protein
MKGAVIVDGLDAAALADYAGVCGLLLAKGHARTSGASMIAGYLGRSDKAVDALCRFARRYCRPDRARPRRADRRDPPRRPSGRSPGSERERVIP